MRQNLHPDDTIAALASAPGPACRGIVRISGRAAGTTLAGWLFERGPTGANRGPVDLSSARRAQRHPGLLELPELASLLPVDVYFWPDRRSFTGETLAELHLPGSPPLLEAVLTELYRRGVRPAEPGEFTLRAFLAGRIDLMQAEAVLGVIDAASDVELKAALGQLAGGLSLAVSQVRCDLLDLLADLEAGLDFADEAIEFVAHLELIDRLKRARDAIVPLQEQACGRHRTQSCWRVVLAGRPNAGKSTLFNALLQRSAAIVSPERGTTRDYLATEWSLGGLPVILVDTAGEETPADGVSAVAQDQRRAQMEEADLVLWCVAADDPAVEFDTADERCLRISTKSDLAPEASLGGVDLRISVVENLGLEDLRSAITERLAGGVPGGRHLLGTTAARTQDSLRGTVEALDRAMAIARSETDQELLAIEIRDALAELGKITGAVYTDDILDRIFSKFCIGK